MRQTVLEASQRPGQLPILERRAVPVNRPGF